VEITATHVISEDPYNAAEARVSRTTDNGGEAYFDWMVITNEGLMLAQDRSEIAEGEPTRSEVENYLYQHIAPPGAVAWKHNDPTEDARWVYDFDEAYRVASEDAGLILWIDEV
jgi:hypothetical protein